MNKYKYKARSKDGKLLVGIVEAVDERQAVSLLRERGLVVVSLSSNSEVGDWLKFLKRVGTSELANFTRQLATMINAGLNLVDALQILENQSQGVIKQVVADVRREVESGKSLSKAMEAHPEVFDSVYVSLVRAGEAGGLMDKVLVSLAENLEKKREFQSKVKGAMLYPIIIVIGMIGVMLVMMLFVIPQLADLYEEFEADLPWMTTALIAVSQFMLDFWWLMPPMAIGAVFGWQAANKNPVSRKKIEVALMASPVFGELWEQIMMANFARTLSLLVHSGVPIVDSLHLSSKVTSSLIYEQGILDSAKLVEKGLPMAQAFAQQEFFPPIITQMLQVGEQTGQVDELLDRIAHYFQTESEQKVKNLTTAIEPLILILLGGGVGFLVFAVVMPIYNLTSSL